MMAKTFSYEVIKHFGTISEKGTMSVELNLVSYSGAEPKCDLRKWRTIDGEKKMQKGITLNAEELRTLRDLLNSMEGLK